MNISEIIALEIGAKVGQVEVTIGLLDQGDTVPFIARYRKEVTGGLDDVQLRTLQQKLIYLRELSQRKSVVIESITSQGKMTAEILSLISEISKKNSLEDLYLPYKPRRVTRGQLAISAGIEPFVESILSGQVVNLAEESLKYIVGSDYLDSSKVLDGAIHILMDRVSTDGVLISSIRDFMYENGEVSCNAINEADESYSKFKDYFSHRELIKSIPAHRMLAIMRGLSEGALSVSLLINGKDAEEETSAYFQSWLHSHFNLPSGSEEVDKFCGRFVRLAWRAKLSVTIQSDILSCLKERSDSESISVFANNLKDLLMAAPAGNKVTIGLDPGFKSGVKFAVLDGTGKLMDFGAIFPHPPQNKLEDSVNVIKALILKYKVTLVAIGNGTASRETERMVSLIHDDLGGFSKIVVSEAGASVYSASELASYEFPDLDVSIRGAISIARRLQDPLAELVKIDPKAIGVGQYQHDVCQMNLGKSLKAVVEDCVNEVGVDLNTASAPLLSHVSGLSSRLAANIVTRRELEGVFKSREQLKAVEGIGLKVFEQCAGFLKINNGDNPLDSTIIHPECYALIDSIQESSGLELHSIVGNKSLSDSIDLQALCEKGFGEMVINSVILQLARPSHDPRPDFKAAEFKKGIEKIGDLKVGMTLQGVVTNVANFGAFIDIGVHQDGLAHISAMSYKYISSPRDIVKAGDVVKVKVMSIDSKQKRIALTMRLDDEVSSQLSQGAQKHIGRDLSKHRASSVSSVPLSSAMADAFKSAKAG
jgi:uncharacterized protein